MRVTFSGEAEADLAEIVAFGAERWGVERAASYADQLIMATDRLGDFPRSGMLALKLSNGIRRLSAARHVIYYSIFADEVRIARILHASQDVRRNLT